MDQATKLRNQIQNTTYSQAGEADPGSLRKSWGFRVKKFIAWPTLWIAYKAIQLFRGPEDEIRTDQNLCRIDSSVRFLHRDQKLLNERISKIEARHKKEDLITIIIVIIFLIAIGLTFKKTGNVNQK